jgi:O-antigen ligase
MIAPLKAVAVGLTCLAIPSLAWLHGGATAGGRLLSQLLALGVFGLVVSAGPIGFPWRRLRGPLVVLLGLAALALVQSVPVPTALAGALAPERVALARQVASESGVAEPTAVAVSLTPIVSRRVALDLVCLAAALVAAASAFGRRQYRRWLVVSALVAAVMQVIVGAGPLLSKELPRLAGSYANPDHVAMLLEMGTALCLAAIAWMATSRRWSGDPERRLLGIVIFGAMLLLLLLGLALTGSRAGLFACGLGLVVEIGLLSRRPGLRRPVIAALALLALAAVFFGWVGTERTFGRVLGTSWYDVVARDRVVVWRESLPLVKVSPWLGTGLGAFRESFALVQTTGISRVTWAKAHNDYLELLITGGVLGLAVLLLGGVWTVRDLLARFRGSRGSEESLLALGVLGAVASVAAHEALDFGLNLPANAMLLAVLVGAALGAGLRANRTAETPLPLPESTRPVRSPKAARHPT